MHLLDSFEFIFIQIKTLQPEIANQLLQKPSTHKCYRQGLKGFQNLQALIRGVLLYISHENSKISSSNECIKHNQRNCLMSCDLLFLFDFLPTSSFCSYILRQITIFC